LKFILKFLPCCFVALFLTEIVAVMVPKKDGEYHVREFGRLPVLLNGRIQPFDSVARNSLLQMRSTGDLPLEEVPAWKFWHHPKKLKATEWLLELMARPEVADTRNAFLIHHSELLGELKLQDKGVEKSSLPPAEALTNLKPCGNCSLRVTAEPRSSCARGAPSRCRPSSSAWPSSLWEPARAS